MHLFLVGPAEATKGLVVELPPKPGSNNSVLRRVAERSMALLLR